MLLVLLLLGDHVALRIQDVEEKATEDPGRDIITTIEAQLNKDINDKVTHKDLYSIFGRQDQEIFFVKSKSFQKLVRLSKVTDQKVIYRMADNSGATFEEIPLGKADAQFIEQLAQNLLHGDKLESAFVYAPNYDDYEYVCTILMDYDIVVSAILHK